MTDDLDRLAAALRAATPRPDPKARDRALSAAMAKFDAVHAGSQGSPQHLRPIQDRPLGAGFLTGVSRMLTRLTSRPGLAASASVAALCAAVFMALPAVRNDIPFPGKPGPMPVSAATGPAVPSVAAQDKGARGNVAGRADADQGTSAGDTGNRAPLTEATTPVPLAPGASVPPPGDASPVPSMAAPEQTGRTGAAEQDGSDRSRAEVGTAVAREQPEGSAQGAPAAAQGTVSAELVPQTEPGLARRAVAPLQDVGSDIDQAGAAFMADSLAAPEMAPVPDPDTEAFANADRNPVKVTATDPVSTFSIDVDTASYAIVRSSLTNGMLPPPDAVRIEEMVNYFPYAYPAPAADGGSAPFRASVAVIETPWNNGTELVRIGIQGRVPALADRPALNLVFLIDTSGSMDEPAKLPLLKQSFRLLVGQLRPEDQVAIVTYAGSAGEVLAPTAASDTGAILAALDRLDAGGATAGQEGLQQAYAVAASMAKAGEVSRVILATDGDFNVGISDPDALKDYIATRRAGGTFLSVLGFGRGNLDDATMQALAQNGNGQAAYVDTLSEAQKVMVDQVTGALFPIASDVKLQVEFNPAVIAEYRLIGYETRALAREDFTNDRVDAGDIGAGHSVTALYEVTPVGSPALLNGGLRYQAEAPSVAADAGRGDDGARGSEIGFLKLRWKAPGATISQVMETPILQAAPGSGAQGAPDADARFAVAIAGMGQLLSGAQHTGNWGWDDAIALANGARGDDPFGYRAEAVQLMRLAQSLQGN